MPRAQDKGGQPRYKISVNDFIIKALALAFDPRPGSNATWTESAMFKTNMPMSRRGSDPCGLITPIIARGRDENPLRDLARDEGFSARARARKLLPEDYQAARRRYPTSHVRLKSFSAIIIHRKRRSSRRRRGARVIVKNGAPRIATG